MAQVLRWRSKPHARVYCELDRWSFDPRYTNGRCPICGWAPAGAPTAPFWLQVARRVDWELFALAGLAVLLVVLGLIVAQASGFTLPTSHMSPSSIASGARTAASAR